MEAKEARQLVSNETLMQMAREKVLEDADTFTDWLCAETMEPLLIRGCQYFGPISTTKLLTEILMKDRATNDQLAEAWKVIRSRYLEDNQDAVDGEFNRLLNEEG